MWIKSKKRVIFAVLFFIIVISWVRYNCFAPHHLPSPTQDSSLEKEEIDGHLTVALVGDIMLDRGVEYSVNKNFAGNYEELFKKVGATLTDYDILFGNLEGPISDKGFDIGGAYSFRMATVTAPLLKTVGFDVLSVANNHSYNWGRIALEDTLLRLKENNILYIGGGFDGEEAYGGKIIEKDGIRITFLAFNQFPAGGVSSTSTKSGIAVISDEIIQKKVSKAHSESDLVIVSYHFGEEYQNLPNVYQRQYAELAIDSGADLVVGHHPHVIQTLEQYKNSWIIYSLGNFIFDQYFSKETMQGGLLEVEINPNTKLIQKVELKKVLLNKYYQIESIE